MPRFTQRDLNDLLSKITHDNPTATRERHFEMYDAQLLQKRYFDYTTVSNRMSFNQLYARMDSARNPPSTAEIDARTKAREQREADRRRERDLARALLQNDLLALQTALGKPLGECTMQDNLRLGGFHNVIARGMRDGQTVADVYTNEELRALLEQWRRDNDQPNDQPRPS